MGTIESSYTRRRSGSLACLLVGIAIILHAGQPQSVKIESPDDIAQQHKFSTNEVPMPITGICEPQTMIFEGPLGIYNNLIVMFLTNTQGNVSGSYFYARHGKNLILEGQVDPATGQGTMTEAWDGKITGYFDFTLTDEGMRGTWRAAPGSNAHPFVFKRLHFPDRTYSDAASKLSGFYCQIFETWIYVNGDTPDALPKEMTYNGWDWLRIRYVGGNTLAFRLYVLGGNGHQGALEGLAHMTSADRAEFTASRGWPDTPPAKLGFEFAGDAVTITELNDCGAHRGSLAYFGGTLHRADEYAVPLPAETATAQ